MINIKLTAPVFKKDDFGRFNREANVEIAGDFDNFSEGYTFLRKQIDELLQLQQADNTLLLNHEEIQKEISNKERVLELLNRDIGVAKKQLLRLNDFLQRLGIDPSAYSLLIANKPIELSTSVDAEAVDPIPFELDPDEENSTDEF
jgi:hypothetical protein